LIFSFPSIFLKGRTFWSQSSCSGRPAIAALRLLISFEIVFASSRRESGVFLWRDFAIFLWSWIFASTGTLERVSISLRLYSCRGDLILFTTIPWIGVFCSWAIFAALRVVLRVTWSGELTKNILSAVATTGLNSS